MITAKRVEALARHLCSRNGYIPDQLILPSQPTFITPEGTRHFSYGSAYPIWMDWKSIAHTALEFIDAEK